MNGNEASTGPSPYDQNSEAAEWLFKAIRGLTPPSRFQPGIELIKAAVIQNLQIPHERIVALLQPGSTSAPATTSATPPPRPRPVANFHPPCPQCGQSMVVRLNRQSRSEFLGCSTYPACRGTRDLRSIARTGSQPSNQPATSPGVLEEDLPRLITI